MTESELFQRYRETGDKELRNLIAEKYLHIAAILAKKFVGRGVEYDDLYQVASLALVKGIDRFDERKGLKFSTFITPTITGEIKNYFRDRSHLIHLPRKVSELRTAVLNATEELTRELGKKPTAAEIAAKLGVSEEEVLCSAEAGWVVSLDRPSEDGDMNYYDVISDGNDVFEKIDTHDAVASALEGLSETEKKLVAYRFGEELSQAETARRMGVSQMYISRMERKILEKLRERLKKSMAE